MIGSGPDCLALQISEDAWNGNAQFTISVDGSQVSGIETASALHSSGQTQTFDVLSNFAAGSHTVSVDFLNDAYGGTYTTDRNLYVTGATINGTAISGAVLNESTQGARSISFSTSTVDPATIGSGPDRLALRVSEDAWNGNAQFTVSVDGTQIGGIETATALRSSDQTQTFTVLGNFAAGSHTASVDFLNDAYGGSSATDRNLYVSGATIDGTTVSGAVLNEYNQGSQTFSFLAPGVNPLTIGSGTDRLALQVSEDAWNGNAQFTVSVDGNQIGGIETASALHSSGQTQTFGVLGNFAAGSHTVSVDFLNDAYGGTSTTDRNLYVSGATIDGATVSGAVLNEHSQGPESFSFSVLA